MKYKIWDKKEKINNAEAEYIIKDLKIRDTDEVFLIGEDLDNIQAIEIDRIIKSVYELDKNLSVEEVAQEYIKIKENEKLQNAKQVLDSEEQLIKIRNLETSMLQIMQELKGLKEMLSNILEK